MDFNGYISDFQAVGGSGLPPTVFGEYDSNGVWQPKKVTEAAINAAKESQQPYNTRDNMDQEWSGELLQVVLTMLIMHGQLY